MEKLQPGGVKCTICGKISATSSNLKKHVENIHFPGSYVYKCDHCKEEFSTRNMYFLHMYRVHKR